MSNGEKLALLMSHLFIIGWLIFLALSINELLKPKKKKEVKKRKVSLDEIKNRELFNN